MDAAGNLFNQDRGQALGPQLLVHTKEVDFNQQLVFVVLDGLYTGVAKMAVGKRGEVWLGASGEER